MNMDDKDMDNDFWDNDPDDDDDDEYNDLGSDVDANNDETFDNAAEWNEDEHEELIARDSILSQPNRSNRNNHALNNNNNNGITNNNNRISNDNNNSSLNDILNNNNSNNETVLSHRALVASILGTAGTSGGWDSMVDRNLFPVFVQRQESNHQVQSTANTEIPWQGTMSTSDRIQQLQLQQQQLLMQTRLQDQDHLRQQQMRDRHVLQQQREQQHHAQQPRMQQAATAQMEVGRQILRVDELEKQLRRTSINNQNVNQHSTSIPETSKRAGWSPFGGKDLFTTPDLDLVVAQSDSGPWPSPRPIDLEQQQRLILQQHQILQQQQQQQQQQLQQLAMLKQKQMQQQQIQQQQLESRLMTQTSKCFTVEELERQMRAGNKSNNMQETESNKRSLPNHMSHKVEAGHIFLVESSKSNDRQRNFQGTHDRRNGDRHDRFDKHHRDVADSRDHRDRRDHRNNRNHRRQPTIIPPQVQLSVIDKARRLHSIPTMHPDEFLQDRVPTISEGFQFKKHSKVASEKANHDGVLTEKERNWLTKIQEKIQADYDDNLDQDYYYLLYFNRSSMTDEAAQKPCGPGVLDRRFIPRERLLYNSGV